MKIELREVSIREITANYKDFGDAGVIGYDGMLNIRPAYQREFVYDESKRNEVINTINKNFPLNVMYWAKNDDGTYEMLDGQQRTISFCQYVNGDFSLNERGFGNLTKIEQDHILDYKCFIYICEGNEKEKLDWFKIINIAGEELTAQELRNAVYTGPWLSHAKTIFSKNNCAAYGLSNKYVSGSPIRQELLQTALKWISGGNIERYMSIHQHDPNANELWTYYQNVINWIKLTFIVYRKEMKGIEWGPLYDKYHDVTYDTKELEDKISKLMEDPDVTNKRGIYIYVLTGDERKLNIREFNDREKREAYERQKGVCPKCGKHFEFNKMHGDHIIPWSKGGKTIPENCQMLCEDCNRRKSNI